MFCNKTKHSLRQKNENLFNSKNFLQLKELLMPFALRLFSRRDLPLNKRDWLSLNSMDRILIHQIQQQLLSTVQVLKIVNSLPTFPKVGKIALIHILASLHQEYTRLLVVPVPPRIRKIYHVRQTFASFVDVAIKEGSSCSEKLRFQSINQLERLKNGFRFPTGYIRITTYKFTAEEIILISLTRLHWPLAWKNVVKEFPGRMRWELQKAFYWFLDFMIINWTYLLLSNREFWLPYFPIFAEAMRNKLTSLPREESRELFPHADDPDGGFDVAVSIDNTINAMNRVGGGPISGGVLAPRCSTGLVDWLEKATWNEVANY